MHRQKAGTKKLQLNINESVLMEIDKYVDGTVYTSRAQYIRQAISEKLDKMREKAINTTGDGK